MAARDPNMPFIRNLASSDRKIRTQALTSIQTFLSSRRRTASLSPVEILKLWKGLHYALWMCDRPIPQQNLCNELAGLMHVLPREAVVPWLRGFWATMAREWTSIDVLRMEKFLLLVRRVLGASFGWMKQDGDEKREKGSGSESWWHKDRVNDIIGLLKEWPFSTGRDLEARRSGIEDLEHRDLVPVTVAAGLRIHVLDIWIDEAEKAGLLETEEDVDALKILEQINKLVEELQESSETTSVKIRAKSSICDERLPWNKRPETGDGDDANSWDGFED